MLVKSIFKVFFIIFIFNDVKANDIVTVSWDKVTGYEYSLDIVEFDHSTQKEIFIGPCRSTSDIGTMSQWNFKTGEVCKKNDAKKIADVKKVRLCYSSEHWSTLGCSAFFQFSNNLFIPLDYSLFSSPKTLEAPLVKWNTKVGFEYSLDLKLKTGERIAPCVPTHNFGQSGEYRLYENMKCAGKAVIDLSQFESLSICYTNTPQDWSNKWNTSSKLGTRCSDYKNINFTASNKNSVINISLHPAENTNESISHSAEKVIDINWQEYADKDYQASFDIRLKNGTYIASCLNSNHLRGVASLKFSLEGEIKCDIDNKTYSISDIKSYQLYYLPEKESVWDTQNGSIGSGVEITSSLNPQLLSPSGFR